MNNALANTEWDKQLTLKLVQEIGLDWEKARMVVGVVAEERQHADLIGYKRGYENALRDSGK